jgi:hypothetical protein
MSTLAIRTLQQIPRENALLPRNIKRPKVIMPHAEPPPPAGYEAIQENTQDEVIQKKDRDGTEFAQHLLNEGLLEQHVGAGVYQGPNYEETNLYCLEAHEEGDPSKPLLPEFLSKQQFMVRPEKTELKLDRLPRVKSSDPKKHKENQKREFNFSQLSPKTQKSLIEERALFEMDEGEWHQTFKYDHLPKTKIFKDPEKKAASEESRSETQERRTEDAEEMKE